MIVYKNFRKLYHNFMQSVNKYGDEINLLFISYFINPIYYTIYKYKHNNEVIEL